MKKVSQRESAAFAKTVVSKLVMLVNFEVLSYAVSSVRHSNPSVYYMMCFHMMMLTTAVFPTARPESPSEPPTRNSSYEEHGRARYECTIILDQWFIRTLLCAVHFLQLLDF